MQSKLVDRQFFVKVFIVLLDALLFRQAVENVIYRQGDALHSSVTELRDRFSFDALGREWA